VRNHPGRSASGNQTIPLAFHSHDYNDLDVAAVDLWKFVDDTTLSKTVCKHQASGMQDYVDDFTIGSP
jgi:hypothetical protein